MDRPDLLPRSRAAAAEWPPCGPDTVYDYGFAVWPDEENPRMAACPAVLDLFRHAAGRNVMPFTERAFGDFRESLARVGLALREIDRVPHLEPAGVR